MTQSLAFQEEIISQIPAVRLLKTLGYSYLTPSKALALRGGKYSRVVLEGVLLPWLRDHNDITFKGQTHAFSAANLHRAAEILINEPYDGLISTNKRIYELLTLGTSLPQAINGDTKSFSLHYIDWQHPENNVYHVSEEFSVEKHGSHEKRRPDIVLFVNGIPLVIIECKRPDLHSGSGKAFGQAVSQMLRNQRNDEIPRLFIYSQLLLAVSVNDASYATTGTSKEFWSLWQEEKLDEKALHQTVNVSLSETEKQHLYPWRKYANSVRAHFESLEAAGKRLPTPQDRTLFALLPPARLLRLIYRYIVYDNGVKKIARYQQYFAVEATLRRVAHLNAQGTRTGGVIWHTTGSGKSLSMVMLAKGLALHPNIRNPKVVIVTDRINLDTQISNTFKACGKPVVKAKSGHDLGRLISSGQAGVITTVIDKFDTAARIQTRDEGVDVFVLVDEGHRSQYGSAHAKMRQVLRKACYIGFTGTPLLKKEKSTALKFGGIIHAYSMRQAVADKAVVPLLYEGRMAELGVDQTSIDRWFERVTADLTPQQQADLKRKFSRHEAISQVELRVAEIAYDISKHYQENFQHSGFKAQLATHNKAMALRYKHHLDDCGHVTSAVLISGPDAREGHTEVDGPLPDVALFWQKMMARYRSETAYNTEIKADFARAGGVEILIVVDKLLVGFDEPRNTVLYIDKPLKEHGLLQAIARVNRVYEGKDFGYIVDYRGVLGKLNAALETYNALEGFDPHDVEGSITDVSKEIAKLPQRHSELWDIFKSVRNKSDVESLMQHLAPEDVRQQFYEALNAYARTLKVALSAVSFYDTVPEAQIQAYKDTLRDFHNLRVSVKQRYAESIDYQDYERRVSDLLDKHIHSSNVLPITEQVNVFDVERFQSEVDKIDGIAAKADTIAHRIKRTASENMDKDPAFYTRFSILITKTIADYRQGRIDEAEYYKRSHEILRTFQSGHDDSTPDKLSGYRDAGAYYGVIHEPLASYAPAAGVLDERIADIAIHMEHIIEDHKITDWTNNEDVKKGIRREIDMYLGGVDLPLRDGDIDVILDKVLSVAQQRSKQQ